VLELERQDASAFQPLPFHYIEIAHFLFQEVMAREVFGDAGEATEVRAARPKALGSAAAQHRCALRLLGSTAARL
jgi:hypothetical protein